MVARAQTRSRASTPLRRFGCLVALAAAAFATFPSAVVGQHAPFTTNCFFPNTSSCGPGSGAIVPAGWESSWSAWNNANMTTAWSSSAPYLAKRVWTYLNPSGPAAGPWVGGSGMARWAVQPYSSTGLVIKGKCGNAGSSQTALGCATQLGSGH